MDLEVTKENGEKVTVSFSKNKILIGRSKDADLHLEGEDISRKHLHLEYVDGKYFVEDLGAANGIYVNQQRVTPNSRQEVQTFFAIQVGANIFINIIEKDDSRPISGSEVSGYSSSRSRVSEGEKTSPRQAPHIKGKPSPRSRTVKDEGKERNLKPYLMLALILGGAGYYFFQQSGEEEVIQSAPVANVSPQELKQAEIKQKFEVQLTPGQLKEKKRLEEAFNSLCATEEEKTICSKLRPEIVEKEGVKVIPDQNKLIVFRHLETTANSIWGSEFSKIPIERRYPFILSYLSLKYQKEFDFKLVEVIDYKITENVFIPLSSSEVHRKGIASLTPTEVNDILEKAKENGDLTQFDANLRSTHIIGFFVDPAELQKSINR